MGIFYSLNYELLLSAIDLTYEQIYFVNRAPLNCAQIIGPPPQAERSLIVFSLAWHLLSVLLQIHFWSSMRHQKLLIPHRPLSVSEEVGIWCKINFYPVFYKSFSFRLIFGQPNIIYRNYRSNIENSFSQHIWCF